ncbi:MAG: S9 family peptidase, partial [Firmicutes bacterium]|nr:S9 family peptidase [Bacillota bacterium]
VERLTPVNFDVMSYDVKENTVLITGAAFDDVNPHEKGLYAADLTSLKMRELIAPYTYEIGAAKLLCCDKALVQMKKMGSNRYACGDLCSVDLCNGAIVILHGMDFSVGSVGVTTDAALDSGKSVVVENGLMHFIMTEYDSCYVRTCTADGVISEKLTEDGAVTSIDVKNGHTVMVAMRGDRLPELYELNEKGEEVCLTCFNKDLGGELCVSSPEFLTYTGSDGFDIHGFVMKPAGYEEGKKYPVILNIHGGPRGVFGSVFHHEMQLWANSGYFVIYCNPRGSDGRGEKFANLYGKYGDWDYVNIMEFTDVCLDRYPAMDEQRMGVTGGSYGGYMTNWIIGKTDRFKAACAQRSISNWITYEGTGDISYWFNEGEHGATIENAKALWDISPMKFADKAKTPTLFIHSDQDYRCFMGEGITMYTVLKMNGVDARLVLFKGENHNLSRNGRPRSRVRRMEEIVNWMDKYLKDGEKNA